MAVKIAPLCSKCKSPMVNRRNHKTGQDFWGCSQYPNCRGSRSQGISSGPMDYGEDFDDPNYDRDAADWGMSPLDFGDN